MSTLIALAPVPTEPRHWQDDLNVVPAHSAGLCHWCGICYSVEDPIKVLPGSAGWGHPGCADTMWAQFFAAQSAA